MGNQSSVYLHVIVILSEPVCAGTSGAIGSSGLIVPVDVEHWIPNYIVGEFRGAQYMPQLLQFDRTLL